MAEKRKIGIFTGNRAEYGLQYPIIRAISEHPELEYHLFVSGAHLDEDMGRTRDEIGRDGFSVHAEIEVPVRGDALVHTAEAIGGCIAGLTEPLARLAPDLFVVYADRFEGFAALIASTQMGIPTAHIEGGDVTEGGALDDSVRHAMTKLAHLHFTTNPEAAERILRLGEEPWRVTNAGYPTIDLIRAGRFAPAEEVVKLCRLDLEQPLVAFSQHSVSTEFEDAQAQVRPSLEALVRLADEGCQIVITYPNNDAGGRAIIQEIELLSEHPGFRIHRSLGRSRYHGLLKLCADGGKGVYAGNSSSGIKETPAFGIPAIDIGARQKGRLRARNVLDVGYDADEIYAAIRKGIEDKTFRDLCHSCENPYGTGNSGKIIADRLASVGLGRTLIQKKLTY